MLSACNSSEYADNLVLLDYAYSQGMNSIELSGEFDQNKTVINHSLFATNKRNGINENISDPEKYLALLSKLDSNFTESQFECEKFLEGFMLFENNAEIAQWQSGVLNKHIDRNSEIIFLAICSNSKISIEKLNENLESPVNDSFESRSLCQFDYHKTCARLIKFCE